MTAKELLTPRFEVIADFPSKSKYNIDKVGSILIDKGLYNIKDENGNNIFRINFEKYPHLFRKMNWWEKRTKSQMPTKLISLASKDDENFVLENEEVHKILDWDMETFYGIVNHEKRQVCSLLSWNPEYGYIPVD